MNQTIIVGRLTKEVELRFIPGSGKAVARLSVAVNREYKSEGQPDADFFNVVSFGKQAENAANYLKKGKLVAITGSMQNNNYEDRNGVKHYGMNLLASRIEFLEWGDNQDNQQRTQPKQQNYQQNTDYDSFQPYDESSDIPF